MISRWLAVLALCAAALWSQISPPNQIRPQAADPSGACPTQYQFRYNSTGGTFWGCKAGTWTQIGSASSTLAIGAAVTGGTSKAVLYIDASGNLAQDPTNLSYDSTGPLLAVNNAGSTNNSATKYAIAGQEGGCNVSTMYDNIGFGAGAHGDFGTAGCVQEATGSTQLNLYGILGLAQANDNGSDTVAGGFFALGTGNGAGTSTAQRVRLWGINPLCADKGFTHYICQNEFDFNVTGTDTRAFGISIVGASTHTLEAGSGAISIGPPGSGINWPKGLIINDGSIGVGDAIYLGLQTAGGTSSPSQLIRFSMTDAVPTLHQAAILGWVDGGILFAADSSVSGQGSSKYYFNFGNSGTKLFINSDGSTTQAGVPFLSLGAITTTNGTNVYCTNCAPASNPCTGASTGAMANRLNGAWDCR